MDRAEAGRAKLLELLGASGARPVHEVIDALTYREVGVSPAGDLATVIARPDEFRDALLAVLGQSPAEVELRIADTPDDRHEYCLHTFAIYLLALFEDVRAFQPIVAYLSADPEMVDMQLEEILTEDMPAILARTYDGGGLESLKALIENTDAPPFVRSTGLRGLHAMALLNKVPRAEVVDYFDALASSMTAPENEAFIDVFALDMSHLQEPRLRKPIECWFDAGLIDQTLLSRADIVDCYDKPHDHLVEELTRRERFDGLIDYLREWPWFVATDPSELRSFEPDDLDDARAMDALMHPEDRLTEPFVREGRKIGRNEPCPCGSGKKYKVCCLAAASA